MAYLQESYSFRYSQFRFKTKHSILLTGADGVQVRDGAARHHQPVPPEADEVRRSQPPAAAGQERTGTTPSTRTS